MEDRRGREGQEGGKMVGIKDRDGDRREKEGQEEGRRGRETIYRKWGTEEGRKGRKGEEGKLKR